MKVYSIAIDGPAGAGKSTLAQRLAQELGFLYVDTGAIYRTVGLYVARNLGNFEDGEAIRKLLPKIRLGLVHGKDGSQRMILHGEDVTEAIRSNEVSQYASQVSAFPEVRKYLLQLQRDFTFTNSVVMDGRDIGTVVLPHASLKIFLTASPQVRAARRQKELAEKGQNIPLQTLLEEIEARDYADTHREVAPLKKADDAVELDTSSLTIDQTDQALRYLVKERLGL